MVPVAPCSRDHVYMASEFIGESYYIGRVMEFGKQIKGKPLQVRIGWFYRPKDVMARKNHDPRLLVATMHSDMNPLTSIRGRCIVTHQAYIKDLDAYKKKPDHFYYNQLFDRYIHRFYDVLPVDSVRNLPPDVAEELTRRYQYIVVEAGTASEYTDAHRVCLICKRWCASGEALKCIMCQGFHHMLCINPPMLRKPSKGFAFQCALCTKLAMDSGSTTSAASSPALPKQSLVTNNSATSSGQNSPRGSPKQNAVPTLTVIPAANGSRGGSRNESANLTMAAPSTSQDQKMSHMWPFRYFGTHADIQDIFDPDDRVYPRASSRVGSRYQAVVVKWDGPGQILATSTIFDDPQYSLPKGRSRRGGRGGRPKLKVFEGDGNDTPGAPSSPARSGAGIDDAINVERGGDETVSLMYSKPNHISEEYVANYLDRVKELSLPIPIHNADLIDKALLSLQSCGFDADNALKEVAKVQKQDLGITDWTLAEIEAFEEGIRLYGHELFAIKKKVETRSMKDIVRFFYMWKKTERYQTVYSVFTKINKPNKKFKSVGRGVVTSLVVETGNRNKHGQDSEHEAALDHDSVILPSAENSGILECAHCGTTSTSMWRRTPGEVDLQKKFAKVFCNDCGNEWIRYIALPPLADAQKEAKKLKPKDKDKDKDKDLTVKGQANGASKLLSVAVDTANGAKRKRGEPKAAGTKRIKEQSREPTRSPSPLPEMPCAVCDTLSSSGEQLLSYCYGVSSTINHRKWNCDTCQNNQNPTCSTNYKCVLCTKTSDQGPQALKRTTGNNWVHILCAVWIPEITFVNVETLSPVESVARIRQERWKQACSLCKQKAGACISCGEGCKKAFHVTCARDAGYQIAFEMQPTKNIKGGLMVPMIWCPNHDLASRKVIQIRDQPDALTDRNALQTYVHYYKGCDTTVPCAMRKSRLLVTLNPGIGSGSTWHIQDSVYGRRTSHNGGNGSKGSTSKSPLHLGAEEVCMRCATTNSPMWWEESWNEVVSNPTVKTGLPYTPPPSQPPSEIPVVKLENHNNDHVGTVVSKGQHEPRLSLVCHACFWDAKADTAQLVQ
ncbi:putative PHD type zinc finger protein with BAH domain-containing protein [Dissophora globulifera]|uniref:PHD type zinc finger protein with BAH domain-containing protein n=1 Tax=Dissophora globulifera TaxID=979702 RepID=A0A9P6RRA7_9FUNG|nr:putative PHD type zinc finger protein with BAH domain-containing protein [Dissophora globulifera]